jgi:hypothetical protein
MVDLSVKIDASKMTAWAEKLVTGKGLVNALRRATDQSARAARKAVLPVIDQELGVPRVKWKGSVGKVLTTTASNLSARIIVSKQRVGILDAKGATISKPGGLRASIHSLSGGGSSHLDVKRAFLVTTSKGGRFVATRVGKARLPLHGLYATDARVLGQSGNPVQEKWREAAEREMHQRVTVEVQRHLLAESTPYSQVINVQE